MNTKKTLFQLCFFVVVNIAGQEYLPKSSGKIIKHSYYSISYNENHEQANWTWYKLTASNLNGNQKRTDNFREDPYVSSFSSQLSDYKGSGFDRGHLVPAGDMKMSYSSMSESFFLSNISPQRPAFNRGGWKKLESMGRSWAKKRKMYVYTGGVLENHLESIGNNRVSIPNYFYKIFFDYEKNEVISFVMPNNKIENPIESYIRSVDYIEKLTGIDFLHHLKDSIEDNIEKKVDFEKWDLTTAYYSSKNPSKFSSTSQCNGTTKKGDRCKNKTKNEKGYCYLHNDDVDSIKSEEKLSYSIQCSGLTKSGNKCRNKTLNSSGRCYLHNKQSSYKNHNPTNKYNSSLRCRAITKSGTRCKRKVSSGSSFCWQH